MTDESKSASGTQQRRRKSSDVTTRYIQCSMLSKWTLKDPDIRDWVESHLSGRVLNACAGQSRLNHDGEVIRNDLDTNIESDYHVDAAELPLHLEQESFDTIFYDPPWSHYQSNLRYQGRHVVKDETTIDISELPFDIPGGREKQQVGHARLIKDGFDYLLRPGGKVVQLTLHGCCMPQRLEYQRQERTMFDPIGEAKVVVGSVDMKTQSKLEVR